MQQKLFTTPESFYTKNTLTPTILLQQQQTPFTPNKNKNMLRQKPITPHVFILKQHKKRTASLLHQKRFCFTNTCTPEAEAFYTRNILHQTAFSPEKVFTESFYTKGLLHHQFVHQKPFAPQSFDTKEMLHPTDFTPADAFSTTRLLRQKPFTPHAIYIRIFVAPHKAQSEYAHTTHFGVQSTIRLRTFKALACKTQKECTASPIVRCKTLYIAPAQPFEAKH